VTLRKVNLNGQFIIANCSYCGSGNVGMSRSPVWNDGEWKLPNKRSRLSNGRTLMLYDRGESVESQYSRAFCLNCEGDTKIVFKTVTEPYDIHNDLHVYVAEITERIPVGNDGEFDCVYFNREFDSMEELERKLLLELWDENCDVKISKIMKEV